MSVNSRWNASRSIFAGDFILGISAKLLAQTGNPDVSIKDIKRILSVFILMVNSYFSKLYTPLVLCIHLLCNEAYYINFRLSTVKVG